MSAYQSIDDAVFTVSNLEIVKKKHNPAVSIIIFVIGLALIAVNYILEVGAINANLSAGVLFVGLCVAIFGLVRALSAIYGKGGVPIYKPTGSRMIRYKLYFDTSKRDKVCECVKAGDFEKLASIERSESSAVMVIIYRSQNDEVLLCQVFEFVPHYHQPMMDVIRFNSGEFKFSESLAK